MIAKPYISELSIAASVSKRVYANPFKPKLIVIGFPYDSFSNGDQQQYAKTNAFLVWLKSFITTNTTQTMEIN